MLPLAQVLLTGGHRGLGLRPEPRLEDTKSSESGLRLSVVTVGRKEQ